MTEQAKMPRQMEIGEKTDKTEKPGMPKKPCVKCLLRDLPDEKELHRVILERLEQMIAEEKADDAVYEKRLKICGECPFLNRGTCVKCGCYAELRCAKRRLSCPDVPPRWEKEEELHGD